MRTSSSYRLLAIAACIFPILAGAQTLAPLPRARHAFIVVSHRGDHTQAPENTLAAFGNAIKDGADCVEIDLRTTVDSQLVIMHDATVDRMTDGWGTPYCPISRVQGKDLPNGRWRQGVDF